MKRHNVVVQQEAQQEINAILVYQNSLEPKKGRRFIDAFDSCIEQLRTNPSFQYRRGRYRHIALKKLPYRVVYEVEDGTVYVYQVRHTSRKPSKKFAP